MGIKEIENESVILVLFIEQKRTFLCPEFHVLLDPLYGSCCVVLVVLLVTTPQHLARIESVNVYIRAD